jgi:hypothetical protein
MAAFVGHCYNVEDSGDQITSAFLTRTRLSLEWEEGEFTGALTATSTDGDVYEGTARYKGYPDELYHARLGRYSGPNGCLLLYGEFWKDGSAEREAWFIQLRPEEKPPAQR